MIFGSMLSVSQMVTLYNTSVIPAAVYVLGNLYPQERRTTTLKKCRDLDGDVRKLFISYNMKGRTSARVSTYIPSSRGGLGLKSIEHEVEVMYVRKAAYLQSHQDLEKTRERYNRLIAAGWRNPMGDANHVLGKYQVNMRGRRVDEPVRDYCRSLAREIEHQQLTWLMNEWKGCKYARVVDENANIMACPAFTSPYMERWMFSLILNAAEEQVAGLGTYTGKKCRMGCEVVETAYHVVSACLGPEYTTRHDNAVCWFIKHILYAMKAPKFLSDHIHLSRSSLVAEFMWGERVVKIRAEVRIMTDVKLHHNKPDIMFILSNPDEVIVLELAVSHLQNMRLQETIKRTRYAKNSVVPVTGANVDDVGRDYNVANILREIHRCPVYLGVYVFGALGEILNTEAHIKGQAILGKLGLSRRSIDLLMRRCCFAVAKESTKILMRRLNYRK
ncbi:uncharacterized protein LOC123261458 [Cotesia glomerata]|uniref:uncharacterized protein LOC123261458 n=1 Tax=Cotesia glomerata TaxID=32391 RepID=UPI001D01D97C|nr:uncharacterized protein LOC123261458 [Cotesia glomerata]